MTLVISDLSAELVIQLLHDAYIRIPARLDTFEVKLDQLADKEVQMSGDIVSQINQELTSLQSDVAAQTSEVASVRVFIQGLGQSLAAALADAKARGATTDMLAAIQAVHQSVTGNTTGLVSAVAENTPSAGQAPADAGTPATAPADASGTAGQPATGV